MAKLLRPVSYHFKLCSKHTFLIQEAMKSLPTKMKAFTHPWSKLNNSKTPIHRLSFLVNLHNNNWALTRFIRTAAVIGRNCTHRREPHARVFAKSPKSKPPFRSRMSCTRFNDLKRFKTCYALDPVLRRTCSSLQKLSRKLFQTNFWNDCNILACF